MDQESRYRETVEEFEKKLGRELSIKEIRFLRELFGLNNSSGK